MTRRDDLERMRTMLWESIELSPAEKRAPLVAQLRGVVQELDASEDASPAERSGLIDFQEALGKRRQSAADGSRRS